MTILNIDFAFEPPQPSDKIHDCSAREVLNRLHEHGERLLFAAKYPIEIGEEIIFKGLGKGAVIRLVDREEFLAWEGRVFPGRTSAVMAEDLYFFEVHCD